MKLGIGLSVIGILGVVLEIAYYWAKSDALYSRYEGGQDESIS